MRSRCNPYPRPRISRPAFEIPAMRLRPNHFPPALRNASPFVAMLLGYFALYLSLAKPGIAAEKPEASKFRQGKLESAGLDESSGIVASRAHPGIFWTHNDSGNPPELFAITREGKEVRTYKVDAKNIDWEDIALDEKGRLLIADTGNNQHDRGEVYVHRLAEP